MIAPSTVPRRDPFVNEALLYSDSVSYAGETVRFIRAGLTRSEPVLVAVPSTRLDLIRGRLGRTAAKVRFVDMADAGRNPNRIIPWVLRQFIDDHPGTRVRIVGEPIWPGRRPEEIPVCVQHEALINTAFVGRAATILCPYDATGLDPGVLAYAARTHPVMVRGTSRQPSPAYTDPATLVGALNQPLPRPKAPATELVFDAGRLRGVRSMVAEHAVRAGLTGSEAADLQLAVHEVAVNTITHATGPGLLRVWTEPDRIICEINGPGQIADLLAGRVRPPDDSDRGRGLLVANQLCDLVQTHSNATGTTTRLHLRRSGQPLQNY